MPPGEYKRPRAHDLAGKEGTITNLPEARFPVFGVSGSNGLGLNVREQDLIRL